MGKVKKFLCLEKIKLSVNDYLLLLLPIVVWFSYHPLIEFGQTDTMYLEISLTLIVLTLFSVTALPHIWRSCQKIIKNKLYWLVIGFGVWNTLSLLWTENLLRGCLTAGLVWLLVIAFLRIITHPKIKELLPALFKIFVISAVLVSIFAWIQMVLDIIGVPLEGSLMCIGCQFEYFGFPRATAFAIEPQFFGSLLLAPILLLIALGYKVKVKYPHYILIVFLVLTLFMTLSRGAIYALFIGTVLLLILNYKKMKQSLLTIGLIFISFLLSLAAQGFMVINNPQVNESFGFSIAKSVNHLSLGVIDFRDNIVEFEQKINTKEEKSEDKNKNEAKNDISTSSKKKENDNIYFDGYVAESTDARLSFNELAYDAWKESAFSMFFGVGLGSAGIAMHNTYPDQIGPLEITQNEYTEIMLELGLVGFIFFAALLVIFLYKTKREKWTWVILAAFLTQWMFFSGYPNAIHIYLVLFILIKLALTQPRETKKSFDNYQIFGKIA